MEHFCELFLTCISGSGDVFYIIFIYSSGGPSVYRNGTIWAILEDLFEIN